MSSLVPHVYERDGAAFTDSRQVAEIFGKRHGHVLRDIDNLLKNNNTQNWGMWFTEIISDRPADNPGRPMRHFELTKDGFTLLAMGFTGEKALAFKVAYIDRFNRMEALLKAEATAALAADEIAKIVDRRVAELLQDQRAVLAEGFVTAHDIRAQHVTDQKHGPKPSAISIKLAAYAERTGNQSAMTRERGGLKPRRLFSLVIVNTWLRTEGALWIGSSTDKKRGQGRLKLVPIQGSPA